MSRICNPYSALVALRNGASFEYIKPSITVSDSLQWVTAIGGALVVVDKSGRLFKEIEKLEAFVDTISSETESQS